VLEAIVLLELFTNDLEYVLTYEEELELLDQKGVEIEQAIAKAEEEKAAQEARERADREAAAQREQELEVAPQQTRNVWDRLADCESGNWIDGGRSFEAGSARWWWAKPGTQVPPWGTTIHHGGLQFHPSTWSAYRLDGYPQYAYDATREQQIAVAERVLSAQGWGAWPTCARKLGLR
jgi:hypothetical protein